MSATMWLARRNLGANKGRLAASAGGIALAFTLVLALDAVLLGVTNQLTRYIDEAGADVFVAQSGVRNIHMVVSTLPAETLPRVAAVDGVDKATSLLFVTGTVSAPGEEEVAYVFGIPAEATLGTPARLAEGTMELGPDQAILDARAAQRLGVGMGDRVTILGRSFQVTALSEGTSNLVNTIAFIRLEDFAEARGTGPVVSYVLVRVDEGADPAAVASRIERRIPGTTAMTRGAFAAEERRLVMDMSGDVIVIMDVIGFVVGLMVVALTVYIATLSRRREFGILKAIGASNRSISLVVADSAAISVVLGLLTGLALTALLVVVVPLTGVDLALAVSLESVAKVLAFGAVIALGAALLPIRQIAGLDPATVFRRGGPR
jgi:putative ABC transport system permease protein